MVEINIKRTELDGHCAPVRGKMEQLKTREKVDLVIQGGKVVTPVGSSSLWVAVDGGKIVAIGSDPSLSPEAKQSVDATGKYVLPGIIDSEHHPNVTPPEETIFSESRAAIATGITTIGIEQNAMIFARPPKPFPKEDELPSLLKIMPTIREFETNHHAMSDYFFTPILTSDRDAKEIPELASDHGVTSFKIYLHAKSGQYMWPSWGVLSYQGFYHYDDGMIYNAMRNIASLGPPGILALHCENWEICRVRRDELMAQGRTDVPAWEERSPAFCEAGHVKAYAYYAGITGCPVLIRHTTTPETCQEILKARAEGATVYGNTSHYYLMLDKGAWRITVPLRDSATFPKMWEYVRSGVIDSISSDHVHRTMPVSKIEEMEKVRGSIETAGAKYPYDIFLGPTMSALKGVSSRDGLAGKHESMVPLMLSEGVNKGRITLKRFVELLCENPAKRFGLYPKKGVIAVGSDADFTIVDLEKTKKLTRDQVFSANGWSYWEGTEIKGWPVMTILRGKIMMEWQQGEPRPRVIEEPIGRYIPRALAR